MQNADWSNFTENQFGSIIKSVPIINSTCIIFHHIMKNGFFPLVEIFSFAVLRWTTAPYQFSCESLSAEMFLHLEKQGFVSGGSNNLLHLKENISLKTHRAGCSYIQYYTPLCICIGSCAVTLRIYLSILFLLSTSCR